ncbi:MAG: hypothetical protein FWF78_10905 [Defluviitaleaceae bacterium]|nr:hypothetical protein [Defluviitaleaceae bacterium]
MDFSKKIFLTFDVDWAIDSVMTFTYDILGKQKVKATFFTTHDSLFFDTLRNDKNIEIGLHPNFNPLLDGSTSGKGFGQIIDDLLKIAPSAVSYRSHCLVQGSTISKYVSKHLKYDANCFIPHTANMTLRPFTNHCGMLVVPYFFEDNAAFSGEGFKPVSEYMTDKDSLKIFSFHPIHVFLNTENIQRYEHAKPHYKDLASLQAHVNKIGYGTMNFLEDIIEFGKNKGFEFLNIRDIRLG